MKKAFAILLVLAIAMVGVFAADPANSTLTLQYVLTDNWAPAYSWAYVVENDANAPTNDLATLSDLTYSAARTSTLADPVVVDDSIIDGTMPKGYVALKIFDSSVYSISAAETASITVSCVGWKLNGAGDVVNAVTLGDFVPETTLPSGISAIAKDGTNAQKLNLTYAANIAINRTSAAAAVGYIVASWGAHAGLSQGTYSATVTINYTTT